MSEPENGLYFGSPRTFQSTQWSLVAQAAEGVHDALERLCEAYRRPLLCFVIRCGCEQDAAEDLVQAFFLRIFEKRLLEVADAKRGKFRTFLLTSLKRFMVNEWKQTQTLKRGGGLVHRPSSSDIDLEQSAINTRDVTPERAFEQAWAIQVLQAALQELKNEHDSLERSCAFETLVPYLTGDGPLAYIDLANQLGTSPTALRMMVSRMRTRLGELIRNSIRQTVTTEAEVEEEILSLFRAFP